MSAHILRGQASAAAAALLLSLIPLCVLLATAAENLQHASAARRMSGPRENAQSHHKVLVETKSDSSLSEAPSAGQESRRRFKRHELNLALIYSTEVHRTEEFDGAPRPVSDWISCESEECSISKQFSHTVTVTQTSGTSFTLHQKDIFDLSYSQSVSRAVAEGSSTSYGVKLDSPGVGRLMFTPRLMRIHGTLIKDARTYCAGIIPLTVLSFGLAQAVQRFPGVDCFSRHEDRGDFVLEAPVRRNAAEGDNQIQGTWWVEYKPDPNPVDDRNFHIIRHKDIPGLIDAYDFKSGSPLMCSKAAAKRGENFAVWREGTCYIKKTESGVGLLTTRFALPIGTYNLPIPNSKSSTLSTARDEWVRQGECDLIQEYEGYGFYCKFFSDSPGTVMMFRKSSQFLGEAGERSRSGAIFRPDNNRF